MLTSMLGRSWILLTFAAFGAAQDWPAYHGGPENTKYSPLAEINTANVGRLRLAWRFDTGDAFQGSEMQSNPLVVRGTMYVVSPKLRVFALEAATGKQKWVFDPNQGSPVTSRMRNRGLTYWESGAERRLYIASRNWFYSIDADTGQPAAEFGRNGRIDLRENLGRDASNLTITVSTPGVVYRDMIILGSLVSEGLPSAPGHIRAIDARTGKLRWIFRTIPWPGEPGYETWPKDAYTYIGGANNWSGMALDEKRGLVFVPTGSAAFDFYGANRHGDNLYANCLIALKAATGERVWHFQFVRHDVWDRDLPAAPTLVRVKRDGRTIDAVAQITKSGHVWVFDRETGKSLFPFEEVKVPASDVDGELLARSQPLPLAPAPFARQRFTEEIVTRRTPEAHRAVLERLRKLRNGPQFTPPSREGTILFPGMDGGGEWGGASWDPETGLLYVNSNEFAWIVRLVPRRTGSGLSGRTLYNRDCAGCHREDLAGSPPEFPSLKDIAKRRTERQVSEVIRKGAGRMPGFGHLREPALEAITRYVMTGEDRQAGAPVSGQASPIELKYNLDGYTRFTDPDGYPAITPPWGTLNAINLDSGEYAWKIPFGEFPELAAKGIRNTGSENYGGGVVTAGGLLFIGATNADRKFRAFDKRTGKLLWEYTMDAAGNATPATYAVNGKQYVVIGAGGGKWGNPSGGSYYAFALPEETDIGSRRELFLDRHLVERLDGAELRLQTPVDKGPVLALDKPWEGAFSAYFTVLKDGGKFRLYYRCVPSAGKDGRAAEATCYAESADGIRWTKPDLGGGKNIILSGQPPFSHNFTPFIDTRPGVAPAERYKALAGTSQSGLAAFVSADGIRWRKLREEPVLPKAATTRYDSQNLAFWSESERQYVCYFRTFKRFPDGKAVRWVSRATSPDFLHWSEGEEMSFGDAPPEHLYTNQTSPYFRAPHISVSIAARFMPGRQVLTEEEARAVRVDPGYFKDCSDAVLFSTRGGTSYDRTFLESFLRPGLGPQNWVSRSNYPALNVVQTGPEEMSFYVNRNYGQPTAHLARYALRLDGFASVHAGYRGGELVTKPLRFDGRALEINYSTSAAGGIRVEIQNAGGSPIGGFALADCREIIGDQIARDVVWNGRSDVSALRDKPVRLRFVLKDADLYSFRFRDPLGHVQ